MRLLSISYNNYTDAKVSYILHKQLVPLAMGHGDVSAIAHSLAIHYGLKTRYMK